MSSDRYAAIEIHGLERDPEGQCNVVKFFSPKYRRHVFPRPLHLSFEKRLFGIFSLAGGKGGISKVSRFRVFQNSLRRIGI